MTNNTQNVVIEKNKDSNIIVNVNELDELSCDNIRRNYKNVSMIEEEFSDRLDYSKSVLTNKLLPPQLQSDFKIVPEYIGGKFGFETKPITNDAYQKFPLTISYTMKFNSLEEANNFRKNGINGLIKKADETGKPVEIPNISSMKEFLGQFENPVGNLKKYGCEGVKLYICPTPIPPAQRYKIDIYNASISFETVTNLKIKRTNADEILLTNEESLDEPYNINLYFNNISKVNKSNKIAGKFNIGISIRDNVKENCEYNKEIIKFKYLVDDSNSHLQIDNMDLKHNLFNLENFGKKVHKKREYANLIKLINLIDKIIYISKIKKVEIKFNLMEFARNEELITLLYNECSGKKTHIKKKMLFKNEFEINDDTEKFSRQKDKIIIVSKLSYVVINNVKIKLQNNEITMNNSSIIKVIKSKSKFIITIESSDIIFKPIKSKK
jgi:hypothetical protein